MKIVINIGEIEFEDLLENQRNRRRGRPLLSSIHDQIETRMAFETELKRLFLDRGADEGMNNLIGTVAKPSMRTSKNYEKKSFIEEIEGEQISLPHNNTPSHMGKVLARSIYDSLNSIGGI